jgi:hypothetical protein
VLPNAVRNSSMKHIGPQRGASNRRYFYQRLLQVSIRNTYYNASGDFCPDFQIQPTNASAELMKSLGLLFQADGSGFSVLLDQFQQTQFLDYLRSKAHPPASPPDGSTPGVWSRLSFMLTVKNPSFFNFTDIPIDMPPGTRTFYLSNTKAGRATDGTVLLAPGGLKNEMPVPMTGSQYRVNLPPAQQNTTQRVIVRSLSGAVAMCQPAYWPRHSPVAPHCAADAAELESAGSPPAEMVYRNPIYLDFSLLSEGKYGVERCTNISGDCQPPVPPAPGAEEVVYAVSGGPPSFFIDLLFTNPGVQGGVYPVKDLDGEHGGEIVPTQYYLDFERRSTIWNYYIVSTGAPLNDLRIETIAPHTVPPITFTGPTSVELPYNQKAAWFVSNSAIPIEEQSSYNFQLLGRAGGVHMKNGVLMNRLPVASIRQVIPGVSDFATHDQETPTAIAGFEPGKNFSDIYVYV